MASYNQLPPLVEPPPAMVMEAQASPSTHHSLETLVVVLAVITIVAVAAGIIARLCGGRHFGGHGEHDVEGWVERKCRSCIDAGIPTAPPPPQPAAAKEDPPKPAATRFKKQNVVNYIHDHPPLLHRQPRTASTIPPTPPCIAWPAQLIL